MRGGKQWSMLNGELEQGAAWDQKDPGYAPRLPRGHEGLKFFRKPLGSIFPGQPQPTLFLNPLSPTSSSQDMHRPHPDPIITWGFCSTDSALSFFTPSVFPSPVRTQHAAFISPHPSTALLSQLPDFRFLCSSASSEVFATALREAQGEPCTWAAQLNTRKTRCYRKHARMDKIWNTNNTKCWQGCGKQEHSFIASEDEPLWKTVLRFLSKLNILLPFNPTTALLSFYRNWKFMPT